MGKTFAWIAIAALLPAGIAACSDKEGAADGWPGIVVSHAPLYEAPFDSTTDITANAAATEPQAKRMLAAQTQVTLICQVEATTLVKDLTGTTPTKTVFVKIDLDGESGFVRRSVARATGAHDIDQIRSC